MYQCCSCRRSSAVVGAALTIFAQETVMLVLATIGDISAFVYRTSSITLWKGSKKEFHASLCWVPGSINLINSLLYLCIAFYGLVNATCKRDVVRTSGLHCDGVIIVAKVWRMLCETSVWLISTPTPVWTSCMHSATKADETRHKWWI